MKRVLFVIATIGLTAGLSIGSYAQERAAADTAKSREEWQSRVNATRERLERRREELRRERDERLGPKREQLRLDREGRIEPMRDKLRLEREKQKDLRRGLN